MNTDDLAGGEKVAIVGVLLTTIGAFLPWVSAGGLVSVSGIDGDGIITLTFGIIVGAVVAFRDWGRGEKIGVGVFGVLTVLIAGNVYGNLSETAGVAIEAQAGGGLHMTLIGGFVLLGAAAQGYRDGSSGKQPASRHTQQPRNAPATSNQQRGQRPQNSPPQGRQQGHHQGPGGTTARSEENRHRDPGGNDSLPDE
jgi:hypothetical protein